MTAFKIEVRDADVLAAFSRLAAAGRAPDPALRAIGEALQDQALRTFETSTDPWGRRWAPNRPATIAAMLVRSGGNFRKDGRISSKGADRVMAKRPLIGEGHLLSRSIAYDVHAAALLVGTSAEYGAMQHFGGRKSEFPNLWGDIPARPFLPADEAGLSPAAQQVVLDVLQEHLLGG